MGTGGFVIAGILSQMADSFGVSIGTASNLIAMYAVVFAIGCPVIATLTPRLSRTVLMVGGLVVYTLGNIGVVLLPTYEFALAGRMFAAVGAAAFIPTATAAAAAIAPPERRGMAISIVAGGFTAATALGAPIGTAIGSLFTWHASLWFVVLVGVVVIVGLAFVLRGVPMPDTMRVRDRLSPLIRPAVLLPLVTILILVAGQYAPYTFFSAVFSEATGGDGTLLAVLLFIYGATSTIGNLAAGALCDRYGNRLIVNLSMLALVATFIVIPFLSTTVWGAIAAIALWGFSSSGASLGLQHRVVQASPAGIAWVSSAIYFGVAFSGSLGAYAIATVGAQYLTEIAVIVVALAAIVGEVGAIVVSRKQKSTA